MSFFCSLSFCPPIFLRLFRVLFHTLFVFCAFSVRFLFPFHVRSVIAPCSLLCLFFVRSLFVHHSFSDLFCLFSSFCCPSFLRSLSVSSLPIPFLSPFSVPQPCCWFFVRLLSVLFWSLSVLFHSHFLSFDNLCVRF